MGFIHEGEFWAGVLKENLELSAPTEDADVIFNVVLTEPKVAVATLCSQV